MASNARDCQCTEDSSMVIGKPSSSGVNSQQASKFCILPLYCSLSNPFPNGKWLIFVRSSPPGTLMLKVQLIKKLLNSQDTVHCSQHSGEVKCKCGVNHNDGHPLIECSGCLKWSHLLCYGLSQASAMNLDFSCNVCQ